MVNIFSNPISLAALAFSNDIVGLRYLFKGSVPPLCFDVTRPIKTFFADEYADGDVGIAGYFIRE